jgi:hypothetical protein
LLVSFLTFVTRLSLSNFNSLFDKQWHKVPLPQIRLIYLEVYVAGNVSSFFSSLFWRWLVENFWHKVSVFCFKDPGIQPWMSMVYKINELINKPELENPIIRWSW